MKNLIVLLPLIICFSTSLTAQFFDKLAKKVEETAEKAIERKVEQKTKKETDKAFDSIFEKKKKKSKSGDTSKASPSLPGLSNIKPANSYSFDHKAVVQFETNKEVMEVEYFLPESGNYLGTKLKDERIKEDFLTVYDVDKEAMFSYMENNGQKMVYGVSFKSAKSTNEGPFYQISATGKSKNILGYHCQEYKMTGEEVSANIWVTKDVSLRFPSDFYKVNQEKNANQDWMKDIDGWAMEMEMVDTSKRKPQTIKMKCLSIDESNMLLNSSDYNTIGQ